MGTVRRVIGVLAGDFEGRDALQRVAVLTLTSFTAAAALLFTVAVFLAMEPTL